MKKIYIAETDPHIAYIFTLKPKKYNHYSKAFMRIRLDVRPIILITTIFSFKIFINSMQFNAF